MTMFDLQLDPFSITAILSDTDISTVRTPIASARDESQARLERERRIDEELAQSFPASDPPSWVQGVSS